MSYYMSKAEIAEAKYLRDVKNLTYKQIGWRLGCKPSEVSMALKTAEKKGVN